MAVEAQTQRLGATRSDDRELHAQTAARFPRPSPTPGSPPERGSGVARRTPQSVGNHRGVPDHGRGVREQEPAVAVENAQAPCRQHQQTRRLETGCARADRERALLAVEPGAMRAMSNGVARTPASTIALTTSARSDATAPATRSASRALARATERRVDRDERRGERALAKQVLEEVGDAERRR